MEIWGRSGWGRTPEAKSGISDLSAVTGLERARMSVGGVTLTA
jgi:hypothetical protein